MRIPIKQGYDQHTTFGGGPDRYYVTFFRQPWHRWLFAEAYHWYDMHLFRLPGLRLLDRMVLRWKQRGLPAEERIWVPPWSIEQDCRCDYLNHKAKVVVAEIEISEETYKAILPLKFTR